MRVDLRSAQALVAKQLLHAAEVGRCCSSTGVSAKLCRSVWGLIPGSRPAATRYLSSFRRTLLVSLEPLRRVYLFRKTRARPGSA